MENTCLLLILELLSLNDLNVRNYRVADQEFPDFLTEIKATYTELRSIADKAASYVILLKPEVPKVEDVEYSENDMMMEASCGSSSIIVMEHSNRVSQAPG